MTILTEEFWVLDEFHDHIKDHIKDPASRTGNNQNQSQFDEQNAVRTVFYQSRHHPVAPVIFLHCTDKGV